jgi:hypothetical protein
MMFSKGDQLTFRDEAQGDQLREIVNVNENYVGVRGLTGPHYLIKFWSPDKTQSEEIWIHSSVAERRYKKIS